ncbi:GH36 C-terminal domain-containing protein [Terrilactibacillus sp. S3-3]|nr:GH36 C-terminal domain-containing protein [Terrilactibacillus sp. S3-3]
MDSPFAGNETAWAFVSPDKTETVVFYFRVLAEPAEPIRILTFKGLDPDFIYQNVATGEVFGGDELMNAGVTVPLTKGDFISHVWRFKRKTYEEK